MLCWLLTEKIITSALSYSTLFSRLGGQCLMLAGASVRYKLITCCWFIVILAGRGVHWTGLLLKTFWTDFALVLLVACQTAKRQFKYFHRSDEFTFGGLVWSMQDKGNERRNLNIEAYFIKLPWAFLPKLTSTCSNWKLLWKRPLTLLTWNIQENRDSIRSFVRYSVWLSTSTATTQT